MQELTRSDDVPHLSALPLDFGLDFFAEADWAEDGEFAVLETDGGGAPAESDDAGPLEGDGEGGY